MRKKGQNLRVFVENAAGNMVCIAAATDCTFHVGVSTEETTTKDSVGLWTEQDVTGKSWDVSCNALFDPEAPAESNAITPDELMEKIITEDEPIVVLQWDATAGPQNRTGKNIGYKGKAIFNDASVSAAAKQNVTGAFQFQGTGKLDKIGSTPAGDLYHEDHIVLDSLDPKDKVIVVTGLQEGESYEIAADDVVGNKVAVYYDGNDDEWDGGAVTPSTLSFTASSSNVVIMLAAVSDPAIEDTESAIINFRVYKP